ncbi:RDD family protein, partial [Streptomyces abyssalis]
AQQQPAAPGAAQPSWAQQVHDLAGGGAREGGQDAHGAPGPDAVMPWRPPPGADPFSQAAQEARPAALGKRFGARLVDGSLTAAVAVAVAYPFAGKAVDHVQAKIDAVRDAGETKTVWLIDGTTGGYLAVVLGALLLFGLLYEVLPTGRWGRTLGKKLFGLRVLTMEQQDKPGFGGALLRWLTYGVLSALVIGVLNVLWCVFDRPWRQCWHDKLAGTFVSKDSGQIRL